MPDSHDNLPRAAAERLNRLRGGGNVSRAQFLAGAGAAGLAAFLAACGGADNGGGASGATSSSATPAAAGAPTSGPAEPFFVKGGELNIYSWPDYFAEENLDFWKEKTGVKLNIEAYESNEDMFAKLNTAAKSAYDIAIPTSEYTKVMADLGIIGEIDASRIPWQYIDPNLLDQPFDPGNKFSIPKTFGTSGVLYSPERVGAKLTDYKQMVELLQTPEQSGHWNLPGAGKSLLNWGMQVLGYDYNSTNVSEWEEAADFLTKSVVKHANAFGTTFDQDQVTSGKVFAMSTDSAVARRAIIEDGSLEYAIPGPQTQLWVDNYVLIKDSPNLEAAYSFLSYFLQPEVQVKETEGHGYATALKGVQSKIDKSFPHPEVVFPTAAQYENLVPSELNEEIQGDLNKLGAQVVAAAG